MVLLEKVWISVCSYFIYTDLDSGSNKTMGSVVNSMCVSVCLFSGLSLPLLCLSHSPAVVSLRTRRIWFSASSCSRRDSA